MFRDALGIDITQGVRDIVDEICAARPSPDRDIDQVLMRPDCMLMQLRLTASYLKDRNIIFVGDDDHMSVLVGIYGRAAGITVVDIDPRVLESIEHLSQKFGLKVRTYEYDVLEPLPDHLVDAFDFFYVNPPYGSKNAGESGIAFIGRCIESCKPESSGCIILPYDRNRRWTMIAMQNIQKFLLGIGYVIAERVNGLHRYYHEDEALTSSVMIVDRMESIDLPNKGRRLSDVDLY